MSGKPALPTVCTDQKSKHSRVMRRFRRRKGFSGVRRVCTVCQKTIIHPNDAQYSVRVCLRCATEGLQPSGSLCGRTSPPATLVRRAERLQVDVPKSERWFQDCWERLGMRHAGDQYNVPFGFFIPDCINHEFKYIVEVDGEIHERKEQRKRDRLKDRFYRKSGYDVFRLVAFDDASLEQLCDWVDAKRGLPSPAAPRSPKYILRKGRSL